MRLITHLQFLHLCNRYLFECHPTFFAANFVAAVKPDSVNMSSTGEPFLLRPFQNDKATKFHYFDDPLLCLQAKPIHQRWLIQIFFHQYLTPPLDLWKKGSCLNKQLRQKIFFNLLKATMSWAWLMSVLIFLKPYINEVQPLISTPIYRLQHIHASFSFMSLVVCSQVFLLSQVKKK